MKNCRYCNTELPTYRYVCDNCKLERKRIYGRERMRKLRADPVYLEDDRARTRAYLRSLRKYKTDEEFEIFKAGYTCRVCGVPTEYPRRYCDNCKPVQKVRELKATYIRKRRREFRKRSLPATLTQVDWQAALEYFEWSCVYCGATGDLHQDHFIPLSKGGGYTIDNIVPSCKELHAG